MNVRSIEEQSTTGSARERLNFESSPTAQFITEEIELVQTKYRMQKLVMRLGVDTLAALLETNSNGVSAMLHDRAGISRQSASKISRLFYQNIQAS